MAEILTVTLNPAVDVATSVEVLEPTRKLRCAAARRDPGGGGINVARVLQRLGGDCLALYLAGGPTGRVLQDLLAAEQAASVCLRIEGETRENFSVFETSTGREFRFVLPGPTVTEREWQSCTDYIDALDSSPRYLVLSGSLPPGAPIDIYARIARCARARGMRVVLDTSGPSLAAALEAGVFLVKPSLNELRGLTGMPLVEEREWCEAARRIVRDGRASIVALTLGDQGALVVTGDRTLRAPALPVQVSSSIGAGDSFVAAMVWALNHDSSLEVAFRYALAAASATLLVAGTGLCERADVERFYLALADCQSFGISKADGEE
ncbi:1-phosphofructokinase family hexose kinase [Paraburkholderia sp. Cpub6]|uniref:1-phosphofructokinase family hexose kinase n=1 Tax=Paraburkholderia sp. Cpub6 TaxID=2723094 RepID=UPI001614B532|nr:1-phosphofructokinase family hexose kinase [Paraburkholderia sp. Cpub6]MBB5462397.1 6-phosphofructokinase 2 [Paraburkholderia sp. Cpub6]